jgi:hypothetical protein
MKPPLCERPEGFRRVAAALAALSGAPVSDVALEPAP